MFRYKLRTLLIAAGVLPPLMAGAWLLSRSETGILILVLVAVMIIYVIGGLAFKQPVEPPQNQQ